MAYLYILKLKDDTMYCGITKDIESRINQHERGESKSTRHKLPCELKYVRCFLDIKSARVEEVRIKGHGVSRWYNKNSAMCNEINIVLKGLVKC
jgi:putative endonuclease